ncbi:MAG: hypothetical protein K9J13_14220 [Saprospiraceae bacterium]|nr:hypothetical protein [Saprospiraceae bacterium]
MSISKRSLKNEKVTFSDYEIANPLSTAIYYLQLNIEYLDWDKYKSLYHIYQSENELIKIVIWQRENGYEKELVFTIINKINRQ